MENKVIAAAIQSREAFLQIDGLNVPEDFPDDLQIVWKEIVNYYDKDINAAFVDKDILIKRLSRKYKKHAEKFAIFIKSLEDVSELNILEEIIDVKLVAVRHQLAQKLVNDNDNGVDALLEEYNKLRMGQLDIQEEETKIYHNTDIGSIINKTNTDNRIFILPESLNNQLKGGALRGHHIVVFAPTEMGKSLFAMNIAYGALKQGLKVLYVGNEDPGSDMVYRLIWRLTGMTEEEIEKEPEKAQQLLEERNYENFIFAEMAPGTPREIESLVKEYAPDVLVVDQIRNLNMGEEHKVLSLEKSAMFMRQIGKMYNLLPISLTQAADSATGKTFLTRGGIDFSNIGIPGTADLLIGIGATEEMEANGERMLSLVKNKIGGTRIPQKVWFDNKLTKVQ